VCCVGKPEEIHKSRRSPHEGFEALVTENNFLIVLKLTKRPIYLNLNLNQNQKILLDIVIKV
jgi:hypothetical protein